MEGLTATKAKLLISLIDMEEKWRTTTHIAQLYGVAKSTVSRAADWCEKNNLIEREESRILTLTTYGKKKAQQLIARREITYRWCRSVGIPAEKATRDCELLSLSCSQEMLNVLQKQCIMNDAKKELARRTNLSYSHFCRAIPNGEHLVSFAFYKHAGMGKGELSMANEGFLHPAQIRIHENDGVIILHSTNIQRKSSCTGCTMLGSVQSVKYKQNKQWVDAIKVGEQFTLPIDVIKFVSISDDMANGVATLRISSTVGNIHMPESNVDLVLFI